MAQASPLHPSSLINRTWQGRGKPVDVESIANSTLDGPLGVQVNQEPLSLSEEAAGKEGGPEE